MTDLEWLEALDAADRRASVWSAAQVARSVLHLVSEAAQADAASVIAIAERADEWPRLDMCGFPTLLRGAGGAGAAWACRWLSAAVHGGNEWRLVAMNVGVAHGDANPGVCGRDRVAALVRPLRWPLTTPTLHALSTAPEAVQVAWDLVCDDSWADHTMADLVEAHARAQRLGLDWADSAQRAVAERARDEDAVRAILAGRAA